MKKLILIGDSLTFGYGVRKNDSFAYMLSKKLPIEIINKAQNGNTTTNMLNRYYEDVTCFSPDYVFIMGGTNDLLSGHSIDSIIDNIEEMILESLAFTNNIYVGIPPYIISDVANRLFISSPFYKYCEISLPKLRDEIINLCNKYNISFMNFYDITKSNIDNSIFTDGIHLNLSGNILILNEFLNSFKI